MMQEVMLKGMEFPQVTALYGFYGERSLNTQHVDMPDSNTSHNYGDQ